MGKVHLGKQKKHPMIAEHKTRDLDIVRDKELYDYYIQNGGTLPFKKYKSIKKMIFIKLMEHVLYKAKRIDIPYFGEIFVQDIKLPLGNTSNSIIKNDGNISELVFNRFNHSRHAMDIYQNLELTHANDDRIYDAYTKKRYQFRFPYGNKIQLAAIRSRRRTIGLNYVKSFKKHPDYIYPED